MIVQHTVNVYHSTNERERERLRRTHENWRRVYSGNRGILHANHVTDLPRDSKRELGDERSMPFVRDVIGKWDSDAIMLTNADTHLCLDIMDFVMPALTDAGCCFSHRCDFMKPLRVSMIQSDMVRRGEHFMGVDMVAFTRDWWVGNQAEYPDVLFGCEGWDWIFQFMMGSGAKLPDCVYHEYHGVPWWQNHRLKNVGQLWNRRLCREWWSKRPDKEEILERWPEITAMGKKP